MGVLTVRTEPLAPEIPAAKAGQPVELIGIFSTSSGLQAGVVDGLMRIPRNSPITAMSYVWTKRFTQPAAVANPTHGRRDREDLAACNPMPSTSLLARNE